MSKLEQFFTENSLWDKTHPQINTLINNMNFPSWWSCQSRSLNSVLNNTYGYWYGGSKAFKTLYVMCALLKDNAPFRLYPRYLVINSEESTNLAENFITRLGYPTNISTQSFNFVFYHVPKGKSYIRPILDTNYDEIRLKQIETFCIDGPQHFIRIYQNFNNSGLNTITVFSDHYTKNLMYTLWAFLPHLMRITPCTPTEETALTAEQQQYNQRVTLLFEFFSVLYNILTTSDSQTLDLATIQNLNNTLKTIINKYMDLFDFITRALSSFTTRLAKQKNTVASAYFERELTTVMNNIKNYETNIEQAYEKKLRLERSLIGLNNTSEEDLKPFMDTLLNSKAIEILSTTDSKMTLKITAPLQYFQESDFEAYEKNPRSTYRLEFTDPILQSILHKVFVTREYQIIFQAIIHLEINSTYGDNPLRYYAERSNGSFTEFPNPHLYHYDCWGHAKTEMNKNIFEGNYELVVMQMIAAVQTMNIAENTSFVNGFLMDIKNQLRLRRLLTFIVKPPEGPKNLNYDEMLEYERVLKQTEHIAQTQEALNKAAEATPNQYVQIEIPDDDDEVLPEF